MNNFLHPWIFIHFSISNQSFRALWRVFFIIPWFFVVFIAASIKNARLTLFDTRRSKPPKTEKSSRFRLLSAPMWHRTRAWLFLYIYFIFISLSSDNTTVFPFYPALSRSFPYTSLCDIECAPPHPCGLLLERIAMRTMRSSPTQAAWTYHHIRRGHTFSKHNFITYVVANPPIRPVYHAVMFHFLFYHIRSSFAISYKTKKLRQRPTLPGVPPCAGSATGGAHGGT